MIAYVIGLDISFIVEGGGGADSEANKSTYVCVWVYWNNHSHTAVDHGQAPNLQKVSSDLEDGQP